jgi:ATP-binding cassette subfamily B protein/subfamily B ATP-binding cassette protein MsbA
MAGVALDALKPWPLKLLVDNVLGRQPLPEWARWIASLPRAASDADLIAWLAAGSICLFVMSQAVTLAHAYVETQAGARLVYRLGADLFDRLQRLSLRFHSSHEVGDLVRRVTTDAECIREGVFGVLFPLAASAIGLVVMFAILWRLDRTLAVISVMAAPGLIVLIRLFDGPMSRVADEQEDVEARVMSFAEQTLSALPLVQAFGCERRHARNFSRLSTVAAGARFRLLVSQLHFKISTTAITASVTAVVIAIGGFHVIRGWLSMGSLLVFISYLSSLYAPLEMIAYASAGFVSASAGARRVREVLEADERVEEAAAPVALAPRGRPGGRAVRFEGVTVGYAAGRPVLHEVSFEVAAGETVAIVGPTGAGKSTLLALVPRLADVWSGRVAIDGEDVRRLPLANLRSEIAMVLQTPWLLPLTVAENIAYGRPAASRAAIVAAAVAAQADDFIRRLPAGYDTVVGERGATLSGGEQQRLAIARALLKDAAIVLLDEPTAGLDGATEAEVCAALARLTAGRTTVVSAHRLSVIRRADRVVLLERGRVAAVGTPQDVLATSTFFRRLHTWEAASVLAGPARSVAEPAEGDPHAAL